MEHYFPDGETQSVIALATLIAAVEELSGAHDEVEVGRIVRLAARRLTGADGITVVLLEGDKVHYLDEDAVGPLWKGGKFPIQSCISGWAIMNRQTVVIPDVFADERIPHALYQPTFVKSLVMAPVRPDDPIASIGAYWAEVRQPTAHEVANLETIARATAVALENIRLRRETQAALARTHAASRAKSDFLANISHEIRTPLNGMLGVAQVLSFSGLNPAQSDLVKLMRGAGVELERMVGDVLDFADLQADAAPAVTEPFHLGDLAREAAQLFSLKFDATGVDLKVEIDPAAERIVLGDALRLRQILVRLLDNGLKFTAQGEVVLSIEPGVLNNSYEIAVTDTGPGLPAEDLARLFQAFEQADNSLTRNVGGAGLGLAIAQRLARSMSGELRACSSRDGGARFELSLPLAAATTGPSEAQHAPARIPQSHLRVLIVDDHALNMQVTEMMLSGLGVQASRATNGEEACRIFGQEAFDLILMDVNMPVMDGLTATRTIRALEAQRRLPRTPIVMLTANGRPEHIQAGMAAGADCHVAKPIQITALLEAIHQALGRKWAA